VLTLVMLLILLLLLLLLLSVEWRVQGRSEHCAVSDDLRVMFVSAWNSHKKRIHERLNNARAE